MAARSGEAEGGGRAEVEGAVIGDRDECCETKRKAVGPGAEQSSI